MSVGCKEGDGIFSKVDVISVKFLWSFDFVSIFNIDLFTGFVTFVDIKSGSMFEDDLDNAAALAEDSLDALELLDK